MKKKEKEENVVVKMEWYTMKCRYDEIRSEWDKSKLLYSFYKGTQQGKVRWTLTVSANSVKLKQIIAVLELHITSLKLISSLK